MPQDDFRQELARLSAPAQRILRDEEDYRIRAEALPRSLAWFALVPILYLLTCIALRDDGYAFVLPTWLLAVLSLVPPLTYYIIATWQREMEVSEVAAVTMVDDTVGMQDRLTAAQEFLDSEERTPFMDAAIRDARSQAARARAFHAPAAVARPSYGARAALGPLAGLLAWFVAGFVPMPAVVEPDQPQTEISAQRGGEAEAGAEEEALARPRREPTSPRPRTAREPAPAEDKRGDAGAVQKDRKKSRGDQGVGKSSQAQSSSGQSTGEGQATDQAQPTKADKKKKPKPKPQKPPKERKRKPNRKLPQNEKDSVASSGQGKGRGSSRSPTASEWSSKDQSVADDEEELEDEDDVDDEDEESEARGGLQPNLRQRKPPVNRDLNIGFGGGQPPPHANGRGGPGLPKKQRGVAQLVLGIPYPDQITGQPNPGRTKVTQERIEPQPQNAELAEAAARPRRSRPMGHLSRPVLLPWMQDLVRDFHLSIQAKAQQESTSGDRVR